MPLVTDSAPPRSLVDAAAAWARDDPDPESKSELERLVSSKEPHDREELADRFAGHLVFGTAGLRGKVAAGPNRMNRAVVRKATAAVAAYLLAHVPGASEAGVAVGRDARHGSAEFADEATAVLAGAGIRVHLLPPEQPTPLLAFSVRHLGAAAGIMITASHNPREDNGYKLYLGDGAQIIPPVDGEIEELMANLGPLSEIPTAHEDRARVLRHGADLVSAYLSALAAESPAPPGADRLRIAYTPLHGVAAPLFAAALERAGFPPAHVTAAQAEPDPDFPTVAFPNPEEEGALDLALETARQVAADVVIANDPDGDRLAVALPDGEGRAGYRVLTGDELGVVLGHYVIGKTASQPEPGRRVVATTVVSSRLLGKVAAAAGVTYVETLTGFKWIARAADGVPAGRFVYGYEEALGYCVGQTVRDKDGIGAALALLGLVAEAASTGSSVLAELAAIEARHGAHRTGQLSLRSDDPGATMAALRSNPPSAVAGARVTRAVDLAHGAALPGGGKLPPADVLVYEVGADRVIVRPSGTEPKLKVYLEAVRLPQGKDGLGPAAEAASVRLGELRRAMTDLLASRA